MLTTHAELSISDGTRFAAIRFSAKDSLQIQKNHSEGYKIQNTFTLGFFLNGLAAPNIHFNAFAEVNTDNAHGLKYASHDYNPYFGYPYDLLEEGQAEDNGRTWAFFSARTDWQAAPYLRISGGYDYLSYGPARRNKLTLRGGDYYWRALDSATYIKRPVPMPFINFDLDIAFITYSQTVAQLKNHKEHSKYLHAHRLNFSVAENFSFGLTETVVYGGEQRSVEVIYLAPFVPYIFAEGYVGDRDNKGISADFSWKLLKLFEIYGELFIDDLFTITSFFNDNWWGNKWAASVGLAVDSAKIGLFNWHYNIEYTRIEPWVYTHHLGIGNEYSHFGNSLGSDLGPNSREIYTSLGASYKNRLYLDLSLSAVAKDTAHGSSISDLRPEDESTGKKYLDPKTTKHYQEYAVGARHTLPLPGKALWHIGAKQYIIFGDRKGKRTEAFTGVLF